MKKLCTVLTALLLVVLCAVLLPTQAEAASVDDLTFALNEDGKRYSVTNCNESASGKLVIPATYNGKPVTSIGGFAFYDCTSLTSITIPDSVISIGWYAFENCTNLTSITIPEGVTYIGDDAFAWCESLTSITIPEGVTSIGDGAFSGCTSLTGIHVSEHNSKYSGDGRGVLFNKSQTVLIAAPGRISGEYVIPNSVTSIGDYAFYGCDSLTSITIPDSVTSIGDWAFCSCDSLTGIHVNEHNSKYSSDGRGVLFNKSQTVLIAAPGGISGEYVIPNSVTSIGGYAFSDCTSLTSITIPDSVTSIGNSAFKNCTSLTSITIPDSVTSINGCAFLGCTSLTSITIPDSVTSIGDWTFYGCDGLTAIFRGDAPQIHEAAFAYADNVIAYYSPNNATWKESVLQDYDGDVTWIKGTPLKITTQPKHTYTKQGDTAEVTFDVQGDGLTYQWYIKQAGATKFSKSSVTADTYSAKMTSYAKDRQVYCVITDWYGNSVQTDTVTLHMAATITKQPVNAKAPIGNTVSVQVTAVGDGLTYTWYQAAKGSDSFTKSSTFTGNTYSVEMSDARDGRQVYCVITDQYGNTATTNTVTLSKATSLAITTQPKNAYAKQGAAAKVTVSAVGDGLKYQWYVKGAYATKYTKSSVTKATYATTMSSASKDRYVYCVITDAYGNSVKTNTVRLRMAATVTKQPVNASAEVGELAKVSVKAVGDGLTYTWYVKNPGATKWSKSSITKSTYSMEMTEARDGRQVYCVVTDKYGKTAKTETVTLGTPVKITTQPKTAYAKLNATAKVTVKADGDGLTYTWYVKGANATKYTKSSVTTATYSAKLTATTRNRYVYCVITDQYGNSVKTNTVRLRMAASITEQPVDMIVAEGSTAKITVKAEGDGLTYTWYIKNAGASKFSKSSVKTGTYAVTMSGAADGRQVYCVITDKYGKSVTSKTVTLYME